MKEGGVRNRDKAVLMYDIFRLPLGESATVLSIINRYRNLAQHFLTDVIKTNQVCCVTSSTSVSHHIAYNLFYGIPVSCLVFPDLTAL